MGDYIDRDAVIMMLKQSIVSCEYRGAEWMAYCNALYDAIDEMIRMPALSFARMDEDADD